MPSSSNTPLFHRFAIPVLAGAFLASDSLLAAPSDSVVVFNEIHFHPANESESEWIEVYNQYSVDVELSGWRIEGGIDYLFPEDTVIPGRSFLVIAAAPSDVKARHGIESVEGPFVGRLDNSGEKIELYNHNDRLMDSLEFNDTWPWPPAADGAGASLVKNHRHAPTGRITSWRASQQPGGTPGEDENFETFSLGFSEIATATGDPFFVELHNAGPEISLAGWALHFSNGRVYTFPDQVFAASAYLQVNASDVPFNPAQQDIMVLRSPDGKHIVDSAIIEELPQARHAGVVTGSFLLPAKITPGTTNIFAIEDAIVINEIMYHPQATTNNEGHFEEPDSEWIELYNRSNRAVDISKWELREGIRFVFPTETILEPDAYLLVARDAELIKANYPGITVLGNYNGRLAHGGERLVLVDQNGNPTDELSYLDGGRWDWRADGHGPSLELRNPWSDNASADAWAASDEASRSEWKSYRYRGEATTPVPGAPTIWNELALGMLDGAGEILLDDIRVIEDPDGLAVERMANGSFDGPEHWRFLGNHRASKVEDDGTGNTVLHLIARGACEYQGNQIETTFANAAKIKNNEVYEVAFRARWLAGSSKLNTRLYFNRAPQSTQLAVPGTCGTPGARNSRFLPNIAPVFTALSHAPAIPRNGAPATVTASFSDPDGVESATLFHRIDDEDWQSVAMDIEENRATGEIPGQSGIQVVQFYVEATDSTGLSATAPPGGPESRALFRRPSLFGEPGGGSEVANLHVLLLTEDADQLHASGINTLSNERLPCTVIDGNTIHYDASVRLKGSFVGRDADRVGFNIRFPKDNLFRGIHSKISVDRSTHAVLGLDEVLIKHIATKTGVPGMYDDIAFVFTPKKQHQGRALIRIAGFDDIYLDSQFENGGDGTVYEYEVYRWATTTVDGDPESLKRAGTLNAPNGFVNIDLRDFGNRKEDYRWHMLINNNRKRDDYSAITAFSRMFDLSNEEMAKVAPDRMDLDAVLRTLAFQSLVGPADAAFTGGNVHNFRLYARPDGRVLYLPWDWDSAYQRSTSAALVGGGQLGKFVRVPAHLRRFYGHLRDIIDVGFKENHLERWADHYGELANQNLGSRSGYLRSRANYVLGQLPDEQPFIIRTNLGFPVSTLSAVFRVEGNGWIDVHEIRLDSVDGEPLPVTWIDADTWAVDVALDRGENTVSLHAINLHGQVVGSDVLTITNNGESAGARTSNVIFSEIMYHPTSDGVEFIELANISTTPVDLSGATFVAGIEFLFPENTNLESGERIIVTRDASRFAAVYGDGIRVAGEFANATRLSNNGEQITLNNVAGALVQSVKYNTTPPWPEVAGGAGHSLVPTNYPGANHDKAASWRPSVAIGGSPGSDDRIAFTETDPNSDKDGDGFPAVIEYAAATSDDDPGDGHEILRVAHTANDEVIVQIKRGLGTDDAIVELEISDDLVNWRPAGDELPLTNQDLADSGVLILTYHWSTEESGFVRLRGMTLK